MLFFFKSTKLNFDYKRFCKSREFEFEKKKAVSKNITSTHILLHWRKICVEAIYGRLLILKKQFQFKTFFLLHLEIIFETSVMAYLAEYTTILTAEKAAHLLRRATAAQAYQTLLNNNVQNPAPPIVMDENSVYYKQTFVTGPFRGEDNFSWSSYVKYWWQAQMTRQDTAPSLLEKLAVFWQNHFVTTREIVSDYRFVWRYLNTIRGNALGKSRACIRIYGTKYAWFDNKIDWAIASQWHYRFNEPDL